MEVFVVVRSSSIVSFTQHNIASAGRTLCPLSDGDEVLGVYDNNGRNGSCLTWLATS